nr:chitosanase [uncultured Gellertiella sp.]
MIRSSLRKAPLLAALLATLGLFTPEVTGFAHAEDDSESGQVLIQDEDQDGEPAGDKAAASGQSEETENPAADTAQPAISGDRQTEVEDKLVSVFENDTSDIQYGYIENLDDGRGFTAGRAGFTSGTGDLLQVVEAYAQAEPGNALEKFLPALREVNGTDSVAGLEDFPAAFEEAAREPGLRAAEDRVNDRLYRQPARELAGELGATLPLTRAALYEAGIQHGYGDDEDSVTSIARRASEKAGGKPGDGADEKEWLKAFLEERRADLLSPANRETASEWKESVGRADAMLKLYDSGNFNLDKKITLTVFGSSHAL